MDKYLLRKNRIYKIKILKYNKISTFLNNNAIYGIILNDRNFPNWTNKRQHIE